MSLTLLVASAALVQLALLVIVVYWGLALLDRQCLACGTRAQRVPKAMNPKRLGPADSEYAAQLEEEWQEVLAEARHCKECGHDFTA